MANCKRCAGSGKMKCGSCDGSGYVIRTEIKNPMGLTIYDICEVKITCPGPCKGEVVLVVLEVFFQSLYI
ncbi:hypothetical protein Glove_575g32 [Diversispora epigaea]|uniref:Uncharacterized protein n=1 Tax=Diversispora epigaea TaxID=1348612 RepID=A0A397G9C3_9GLOM|nr:hypothetical protein Glove_575g32 [Diversispora epigaea]